jgi:hypothetical protein
MTGVHKTALARTRGAFRGETARARFDDKEKAAARIDALSTKPSRDHVAAPMQSVQATPEQGGSIVNRPVTGRARRRSTCDVPARGHDNRRFQLFAGAPYVAIGSTPRSTPLRSMSSQRPAGARRTATARLDGEVSQRADCYALIKAGTPPRLHKLQFHTILCARSLEPVCNLRGSAHRTDFDPAARKQGSKRIARSSRPNKEQAAYGLWPAIGAVLTLPNAPGGPRGAGRVSDVQKLTIA